MTGILQNLGAEVVDPKKVRTISKLAQKELNSMSSVVLFTSSLPSSQSHHNLLFIFPNGFD